MAVSPMMQQYHLAKEAAGDALLLFRMGDFYELFFEDAREASRLLGLTLTSREKGEQAVPMAGFPHHQLDQYLAKIVRSGRRAAICDQVEDPRQAKGLVRREVTRVVTPGTLTDDALLDPQASNYLAAVSPGAGPQDPIGLAWVDVSTGAFYAAAVPPASLADALARIDPAEVLAPGTGGHPWDTTTLGAGPERVPATPRPPRAFQSAVAEGLLKEHFGIHSLEGLGFEPNDPGPRAAGALLDYLQETQRASLHHIQRLERIAEGEALEIDSAAWRSLEIARTTRDGRREGSLLGVMDRTVTPPGARLLNDWLRRPLARVEPIESRLEAVAELVAAPALVSDLRGALRGVYDLERLVARVATGRASPRDLSAICRTLAALPAVKAKLSARKSQRIVGLESRIDLCPDLRRPLEAALEQACPLSAREGGFVRAGYSPELDQYRDLMAGGKAWMARYQTAEVERTGIPSIKVGFNSVFGYYLEITHAHRDRVPAEYHRKQTLKNAERYITPELKEHEEKVLSAQERALALEYDIFCDLRDRCAAGAGRLLATAAALAELDVLAGLADLAIARGYVRPQIVEGPALAIEGGRHPVLDVTEPDGTFVPNDTHCSGCDPRSEGARQASVLLITGPNMAGKSTYIRQSALLVVMAQLGSYVPARSAVIGVADRLFARIGASDELARGQSTFMVEMTETARILNTATHRSLVVLDEVGRGTSTYDGLSLAWAIVEHLHDSVGCRTLFATHYHELTRLAEQLPGVANRNVAVREHGGKVVFLHQIVEGAADKSYGIHVAELAGVPRTVNRRAADILAQLESGDHVAKPAAQPRIQLTLFETAEHPLIDELRSLDLNALTPLDALVKLGEWQLQLRRGAT